MSSAKRGGAARRNRGCVPSCFTGSHVVIGKEDEEDERDSRPPVSSRPPRGSWFSRLRGKKKTVPVDPSTESGDPEIVCGVVALEAPPVKKKSSKSPKEKDRQSKTNDKHNHQRPPAKAVSQWKVAAKKDPVNPAAVTTWSHPTINDANGSTTTTTPRGVRPDAVLLLLGIALVLLLLLLFGRSSAVVCLSCWFYLMPRLRGVLKPSTTTTRAMKPKPMRDSETVDAESKEHKKMVVLQGLLERNGRSPLVSVASPTFFGAAR